MRDNKKKVIRLLHTHAMNKSAVARRVAMVTSRICSCDEEPVATMSNGDPPPESAFESWLLAVCVGAAVEAPLVDVSACGVSVGGATVVVGTDVSVTLGSTSIPPVEELDGAAAVSEVDVSKVVVGAACALV